MSSSVLKRVDSSNYITSKRQMAIYNEKPSNVTANIPVKKNGIVYNNNFKFIPTLTDASNCLIYAKNYELFQDYSSGKKYTDTACNN
jgi:hypothetical protein